MNWISPLTALKLRLLAQADSILGLPLLVVIGLLALGPAISIGSLVMFLRLRAGARDTRLQTDEPLVTSLED